MTTAVCPGSFDPVTVGHLDIVTRAANIFDRVIILVLTNPAKQPVFSEQKRVELLKRVTTQFGNVEIDTYNGLLADYCKQKQATVIVKGLRAMSDFEYEFQQALTNKKLNPGTDTVFLTTSAENMYLSSSVIRNIASLGGDISDFVPGAIAADILNQFKQEREDQ